ncbi:MAG: LSU ribosomal protein L13p (L13Ae) [uncultured Thermomicrobiales bacterium]|uniref:Large ribosomal subunit protein uL13 n=1 Tax=uncultured Thermomicrobiales bacterium TaxID=1645740 RepID=A0A6J4V8R6_9BACT|nr:MAG: LSU ribosomal protein L13p (L13Ae) [uncultured Thermomicrobiales bacterium]
MERRTFSPRKSDVERNWYIVDAEGKTLGRLASIIAATLRGKNSPQFAPHVDVGDFVIVINAEKVVVTGKKETQHMYYRHSGYPSGLRAIPLREMRQRHPERIIEAAVRGMLPHNVLGEQQLKKLKVYKGPRHPHAGQQPQDLSIDRIERAGAMRHAD